MSDKKTYSLKGRGGESVSMTLEATEPGPMPPEEMVQAWFSKHHYPRRGSIAIAGYAVCQTERKSYVLSGRGGKNASLALDKVGPGEFPSQEKLQVWFKSKDFPVAGECKIDGFAPCLLVD